MAYPGDIRAVAKVDEIHPDAILHDSHDEDFLHLQPSRFPLPVAGLAISVCRTKDEQRLADALHKLLEEDPCLALESNQTTRETVLRGSVRTASANCVGAASGPLPDRVGYQQTQRCLSRNYFRPAESQHRHKKQTGGAGQFGEVVLQVEPLPRGAGFQFASAVVGGAIPGTLIPAVEKGCARPWRPVPLPAIPLVDLKVVVTDGKHHPVDSKEIAFVTAGRKALLAAARDARPVVMEPIVNLEVQVPQDAVGSVTGDLAGRRGRYWAQRPFRLVASS